MLEDGECMNSVRHIPQLDFDVIILDGFDEITTKTAVISVLLVSYSAMLALQAKVTQWQAGEVSTQFRTGF